ncbi:hypothetical protein EX895_001143 [Sporisorium graminicola]|uniref:Uncharacterized protein n=1 Tax=Sporisorium graminicola TaxID=280036 RepID=A0A4U7KZK8_9BASI|nr:hypothetical protein EX895_001143 [Sporisorium graminicola]TKY89846.1 hypothetical protein EX895_001143 [Sporisorium graminicola]
MLQSNVDTSFKLQPAPRPKSKNRHQDPPPLATLTVNTSPNTLAQRKTGSPASSESISVHSCFEDDEDEAVTPKASLFNVPLLADTPARSRPRSFTTSFTSSKTTNSVSRLLAAMSFPISPRRSMPAVAPSHPFPSATVTLVLSDTSPTPSTPLFPHRTLMRSLSSTCVAKSPTSPGAMLRKRRLGWRGTLSAQRYDETAILMSPSSPLTPRRAEALHTPTQASIASVLSASGGGKEETKTEPLSATLKALGAKRRTERFTTCVPVQSPFNNEFDTLHLDLTSPQGTSANRENLELMMAEHTIFHLPTWVRFEANHHTRMRVAQENRQAVVEYAQLHKALLQKQQLPGDTLAVGGDTLPKTSQLGDVAPSSPNGDLLAGFDLGAPPQEEQPKEEAMEEGDCVVSVVRRPTMAAMREMDEGGGKGKVNVLGAIRSAWPPFRPQRRIKAQFDQEPYPRKALLLAPSRNPAVVEDDRARRDGWGGVLTRASWFPSLTKGPLVSPPPPASSSAKTKGLKTMMLQPVRGNPPMEDEWEDVEEPSQPAKAVEQRSFLELHDAPRFFNRPPLSPPRRPWLTRPRATSRQYTLDTWQSGVPLKSIPFPSSHASNDEVSSQLISKGTSSVENRPLPSGARKTSSSKRARVAIGAIALILVLAVVANVVIISRAHSAAHPQLQSAGGAGNVTVRVAYDPLVGPLRPTRSAQDASRQSTIAKAAQLSEP